MRDNDNLESFFDLSASLIDEELECRVCRGPAEEGAPLFAPCKCSGSIGLVHQDCLASWLKVQRGDGKCELCSVKFQFAPQYAPNTPSRLPAYEVFLGVSRSAVGKWIPTCARIAAVGLIWLVLVPLATSYFYVAWIHGPMAVSPRWNFGLIVNDTITGAIVAVIVIVSFLSLMSFADFLRFDFERGGNNARRGREVVVDAHNNAAATPNPREEDIDDVALDHNHFVRRQRNVNAIGVMDQRQPFIGANQIRRRPMPDNQNLGRLLEGMPDDPAAQREELQRRIRAAAALQERFDALARREPEAIVQDPILEQGNEVVPAREDEEELPPLDLHEEDEARIADFLREMDDDSDGEDDDDHIENFEPQFEPRNGGQQQPDNMEDPEFNMALDELLGLRGPFGAVIRNMLWLLGFIAIYLGFVLFVPRYSGAIVYRRMLNSSSVAGFLMQYSIINATEPDYYGLVQMTEALNKEGQDLNRVLQLNDLFLTLLGYISISLLVVGVQTIVALRKRIHANNDVVVERQGGNENGPEQPGGRRQPDWNENFRAVAANANDDGIEIHLTVSQLLALVLDCSGALVKVGVLLFLKMFILPLALGLWLDAATLSAFGSTVHDRIKYAGADLFSSVMTHWVVGISFMLLVTVSVLQLREVVHPDLLARVIRPQEPQPDLLGNLLKEGGATHTKRMIISFGIYSFLLGIYVWLPSRFIVACGIEGLIPIFRPKLWYLMTPYLQVPLELLLLHLTMLGFLEKHKNDIGGLQSKWIVLVSKPLGCLDQLLPRHIDRFMFVGSKQIFVGYPTPDMLDEITEATAELSEFTDAETLVREESKHNGRTTRTVQSFRATVDQVDPFWYELAAMENCAERFLENGVDRVTRYEEPRYESVHMKRNGKCILYGSKEFIRLPLPTAEQDVVDRRRRRSLPIEGERKHLIPSAIGRCRLRRSVRGDGTMVIELWKECRGGLIDRPPEGWDDLGAGGAEQQGRWAWGAERRSKIEEGVAARDAFFEKGDGIIKPILLVAKLVFLVLLSWLAVIFLVLTVISIPLTIGRFWFFLLAVPESCVHDPAAFACGIASLKALIPALRCFCGALVRLRHFVLPPTSKIRTICFALLVWTLFLPFLIGFQYHMLVAKTDSWFEAPMYEALMYWGTGTLLLNAWATMCYASAFTKQFWANLGREALEGENANNVRPNPAPPVVPGTQRPWQGSENGRIAKALETLQRFFLENDAASMDRVTLLDECINPIFNRVSNVAIVPACLLGLVGKGAHLMVSVRIYSFVVIALQIAMAYRLQLQSWFTLIHDAARDERYLIGQVLLNYVKPS